jgi:hypothetical protein
LGAFLPPKAPRAPQTLTTPKAWSRYLSPDGAGEAPALAEEPLLDREYAPVQLVHRREGLTFFAPVLMTPPQLEAGSMVGLAYFVASLASVEVISPKHGSVYALAACWTAELAITKVDGAPGPD